jgi:hypothetical protein
MDLRSLDGVEVVIEEEQGEGGKEEAIRGQHVPQIVRIEELERNAPCIAVARLCKANQSDKDRVVSMHVSGLPAGLTAQFVSPATKKYSPGTHAATVIAPHTCSSGE